MQYKILNRICFDQGDELLRSNRCPVDIYKAETGANLRQLAKSSLALAILAWHAFSAGSIFNAEISGLYQNICGYLNIKWYKSVYQVAERGTREDA